MPAIRLFDTAAGREVALEREARPSMYVCGITPYDATHMGHAASYVAFDLLNRAWRDAGSEVSYVQNVTDVDDPLLERATATGVDWRDLAAEQVELFQTDMEALNVLAPDNYVGAVESIGLIVPEVERLVSMGLAYRVAGTNGEPDGDVYYDVEAAGKQSTAPDAWALGSISHLGESAMLELFAERGGDPGRAGKRQALDPLLWRVEREGEPSWPGGSLGPGRPGWHIECTVIAQKYLPAPFTVQGGGSDLIFPHHEMGAGHAYSLAGVPLAKHYAHAGMVGLDGEKMSKSKGNLVLVSKLRAAGEDRRPSGWPSLPTTTARIGPGLTKASLPRRQTWRPGGRRSTTPRRARARPCWPGCAKRWQPTWMRLQRSPRCRAGPGQPTTAVLPPAPLTQRWSRTRLT